jgi:hypothetical protein
MVMISLPVGRSWLASPIVLGLFLLLVSSMPAEEDPQAKQRLRLMEEAVQSIEPESSELKTKEALTVASKPLLRYNDPTRGANEAAGNFLLDATVWRLGTEGRPTALVTIEIYQSAGAPRLLSYEFLSLTEAKFALKHKAEKIRSWEPEESGLTLKELPDAPKPAVTAAERLVQMRRLARRFTAKEHFRMAEIECRLLTQPIDRYHSAEPKIVDGAVFVYANSTNPELGVVLETDGEHWLYGTLRMTSAQVSVALDGREIAAYPWVDATRPSKSYTNASHRIDMDK